MIRESAEDGRLHWHLSVKERGLWRGQTRADLRFTMLAPPTIRESRDAPDDHTWVCVAPECRVEGFVTPANGSRVTFTGNGYHDHNFGQLPWRDTQIWQWARASLQCSDGQDRTAIVYTWETLDRQKSTFVAVTGQAHTMTRTQQQAVHRAANTDCVTCRVWNGKAKKRGERLISTTTVGFSPMVPFTVAPR